MSLCHPVQQISTSVNTSHLCVDTSHLCVDTSLLCVDTSLLCVNTSALQSFYIANLQYKTIVEQTFAEI